MKKVKIVWNEVTVYSKFWAIILFVGVLPASAFYAGMRVERLIDEQRNLLESSSQVLYQSERGTCRLSDCSLQNVNNKTSIPASTIEVVSPKQGDHIDPKQPVKVIWNISPNFPLTDVTILLLDSGGHAVSKMVTAPANHGSATVSLPAKLSRTPYSILIQGAAKSVAGGSTPFAYSGDFYL